GGARDGRVLVGPARHAASAGRRSASRPSSAANFAPEKVANECGDPRSVRLVSEVAGIEQMHLGVRIIPLVRFGAGDAEDFVVAAPHDQGRRPVRAEVRLPLRIELDVTTIVVEEVELYLVAAGPIEQPLIVRI